MSQDTHPNLFALLIGIDCYSQTSLPDGSYYPNLGGCVRDINHVEEMLKTRLGLSNERIIKLTSSKSADGTPIELPEFLPTYQNIVAAFKQVTAATQVGDQVYIHYSGHGGRCATMFTELKGTHGLDESLVPCDIGENGACYLRDIEMAYLLKQMSDQGLLVTMVLDSCHSGGATRGEGGTQVRGISGIDTTPPGESAVASKIELLEAFTGLPETATRGVNSASGWRLPTPKNFVMLAACRADELANEYAFDGNERNGALTYWMLDALRQIGNGYTYKMLYNRVVAKVHAKFPSQTPQLEGEGNREIFGSVQLAAHAAVNVISVDLANKHLRLSTGIAQGISKGTQFAVFAANATDFTDKTQRLAVVEIDNAGAAESGAFIVEGDDLNQITEGSQAILLGIGIRLRGRIRLIKQATLPPEINQDGALDKLRSVIEASGAASVQEKWIRLSENGEEADFQVAVNGQNEYEIWDASGAAVPNLRPVLNADESGAAAKVEERLIQLTKYRNARLIDNTDSTSPLARKIIVEVGTLTNLDDRQSFKPFGTPMRPLSVGETACLRVVNTSNLRLNLTIMDLQPDWGIAQAYPDAGSGMDSELLEPGIENALLMPFAAALPADYETGTDVLKVFVTVENTSFKWLEMTALDQPFVSKSSRSIGDALGQLMSVFTEPVLTRQIINLSAPTGRTWATAEVEIQIRRPTIGHVADPALSLLQSAFEETVLENGDANTRSAKGQKSQRPELSDPLINDITQYCVALAQNKISEEELKAFTRAALDEAQERGAIDTVKYCASLAVGMAREWYRAKINGDVELYDQYEAGLKARFGDCDPRYVKAMQQFASFLQEKKAIDYYRRYGLQSDYVIDDEKRLPSNVTIGIVADWGTGEPEALEVLRQVTTHEPKVAIHLGDVYYAGTSHEVENYFYQPWTRMLKLPESKILSFALPGNHDLYAGGAPYYDLLDRLAVLNQTSPHPASYFCLRNEKWQIIGIDTALHDRLGGGPTFLEETEVEWIKDKIENSNGRRTILLSHHQLFSANDQFNGKSYNEKLYDQLKAVLPNVALWLWGHEHDMVIFEPFTFDDGFIFERGRCIGGSAFPVGNFEMPKTPANPQVKYNLQAALSKGGAFYQHCYVVLKLIGDKATVFYYEDRDGGKLLFEETI